MRGLELLNNISNPSVDRPRWKPNKADIHSKAEIKENLPARDVVEFTVEVREAYERRQSPPHETRKTNPRVLERACTSGGASKVIRAGGHGFTNNPDISGSIL